MPDVFTPPAAALGSARPEAARLPWVRFSRWILWFSGFGHVLFGVGLLNAFSFQLARDADIGGGTPAFNAYLSLLLIAPCVGFGVLNLLAAHGLRTGTKRSWFLGILAAILHANSCWFPVGVLLLCGLLNAPAREAFRS